jgi:glycosyltransferase involved in cell wall biosynthesis
MDRVALRRRLHGFWDFSYAVPGLSPRDGRRVVHAATFHPRSVLSDIARARRLTGGGRAFLNRWEARIQTDELSSADVVRTESAAVTADMVANGVDAERIVHAYPGVDLDRFRPGVKSGELSVAFVGTLSLWKGLHLLVPLSQRLGGIHVIGGPVCPWSRRYARAGRFTPATDDVAGLMASSHALVLPSVTDGFAYVVLEAMASGCVPFVTPTVGSAELVRLIDPELVIPAEEFEHRVPELLRSMDLTDLGARARDIAEDFDRRRMADAAAVAVLAKVESLV